VAFIDRTYVQMFFGIMVVWNATMIGLDVQLRATAAGQELQAMMMIFEIYFFTIFLIELIMRLIADRCPKFLASSWNLIDALLVGASGVDLLFQLAFAGEEESAAEDMGKLRAIRLLKVTRLVRLVRVFRIFRFRAVLRAVRGLILLIVSVTKALASLGWTALIMAATTYLVAIVTTEFIGLSNDDNDPLIAEWFGDLFSSMFTLLQLATLEDWSRVARHVGTNYGMFWQYFILFYVLSTNMLVMNLVVAQLVASVLELSTEVKTAHDDPNEEAPSWMRTPSSLMGEEEDEEEKGSKREDEDGAEAAAPGAAAGAAPGAGAAGIQQSVADRLAAQTLSEFFDLASTYVGIEGVNQRKLCTQKSLGDTLLRQDVSAKLVQACPALANCNAAEMVERIWSGCPKKLDKEGMTRQEVAEAVMMVRGELSMNHFVTISQALERLEKHTEYELMHLNKHQRKMNRRFLKLRHRLRKVYHFDGAPRKMVEMVNEMKRRNIASAAEAAMRGDPSPSDVLKQRREETGESGGSEVDLSEDSSSDGGHDGG